MNILVLIFLVACLSAIIYRGLVSLDPRKRIAVMVGSDSDLKQGREGFKYLEQQQEDNRVKVLGIYTNSIHRNMFAVFFNLIILWLRGVNVIVVGAGWAAHLPGMCEAFLRYVLRNKKIKIVPVAFEAAQSDLEDEKKVQKRNDAAILSISEVPKHQMALLNNNEVCFGAAGFLLACKMACEFIFADIVLPKSMYSSKRTLAEVLEKTSS